MLKYLSWSAGLIVASTAAALAADAELIDRGRRVAEGYCSACHATGLQGASPHRIVIPFRDLHQRMPIEMLDIASKTGVIDGHDEMPMFEIGIDNMRALRAYFESLWAVTAPKSPEPAAPAQK